MAKVTIRSGRKWRPRVLIVDDDSMFALATGNALTDSGFEVECVSDAPGAENAIARSASLPLPSRHAFVLLEPLLGNGNALDLVLALRSVKHPPAIAVISRALDNARELELRSVGVEICLRKPMRGSELGLLMSTLWRSDRDVAAVTSFSISWGLSDQQQHVLLGAVQGAGVKETAHRLGVSPETIRTQWKRILQKTGYTCASAVVSAARSSVRSPPARATSTFRCEP
jgi:DNA-binding NarL/FixJ family response regulator